MADLELQVPQQMQDRLNDGFLSRRRLGRGEKHQVEIAVRRHLAAAGSAEPDDGHGFGRLVRGDKVVGQPDELVVQIGRCSRRRPSTIRIERQSPRNFGTALFERAPQDLRREPVPVLPLGQCGERVGNPAPIDDRAAVGHAFVKAAHHRFTCLAVGMGLI